MHHSFYTNQYPYGMNLQEAYTMNPLQYQIAQNQAMSTYPKQNYLGYLPNPYTQYPLPYENLMREYKGVRQQSQGQRERKIDTTENGQFFAGKGQSEIVRQRVANTEDQLLKSKKSNKDITKQSRSEQKKGTLNNESKNNIIIIDDNEEEDENIEIQQTTNKDQDSSSVEIIEQPKPSKQNITNNDKKQNVPQMNRNYENLLDQDIKVNNQNPIQKNKPLEKSERSETILLQNQNNANKSITQATQNNASQQTQKIINQVTPQKQEIIEKQSVIILSDEDEEDNSFQKSSPKDLYTYQKSSKQNNQNNILSNNIFPYTNKNIGGKLSDPQSHQLYNNQIVKSMLKRDRDRSQIIQFDRLLQPHQKNQNQFISSLTQNQIPFYSAKVNESRNQQKQKEEEITIEEIINPHKMHFNNQHKANPVRINPYELSKQQLQYGQKLDKNKLHSKLLKYTKSSSSSPYPAQNSINQFHKKSKIIEINDNNNKNSQNLNSNFKNSSLQQQSQKQNQSQKMGELQSPGLNQSNSMDERDGKQNKKIQNTKFIYCKKCDKQIEQNQVKKGASSDGQDLCKICFQLKQKNDIQEKKYWEQVFRNTEDRINVIEVGVEYQAVIPEYYMNSLQIWQQQNKEKFSAILANKVHSACDNQIYTDVLAAVRQKYNDKYSHNDFQALIKNSKLTLTEMKEKMDLDDQEFLNIIENCSSSTCKNQRVTRLTKRRLEYLQNY